MMREAQRDALSLTNTAMAVTIDIGDPWNVHGMDKRDIGIRLSLLARRQVYGQHLIAEGPTFRKMPHSRLGDRVDIRSYRGRPDPRCASMDTDRSHPGASRRVARIRYRRGGPAVALGEGENRKRQGDRFESAG